MGRPLLMGRKTFEAIGRPLDGRDTIVMTRNDAFAPARVHVARSLAAALRCLDERARARDVGEAIVVGGAAVYAALLPFRDRNPPYGSRRRTGGRRVLSGAAADDLAGGVTHLFSGRRAGSAGLHGASLAQGALNLARVIDG